MDLIIFLAIGCLLVFSMFKFEKWLNSQGVLLPYQKRRIRSYDDDIADLEFRIKLLQRYGPIVQKLGGLELRETAIVLNEGASTSKNPPVQAIPLSPDVKIEVTRIDNSTIVSHDPKQRSTVTRVAVGGMLGGVPGAAAGGMAKKTTKPGHVELRNDGDIYVVVSTKKPYSRLLESSVPIFEHEAALRFKNAAQLRCESPPRWGPESSEELKDLFRRREAAVTARGATEAKWRSR
jgi:hypothetical protein